MYIVHRRPSTHAVPFHNFSFLTNSSLHIVHFSKTLSGVNAYHKSALEVNGPYPLKHYTESLTSKLIYSFKRVL